MPKINLQVARFPTSPLLRTRCKILEIKLNKTIILSVPLREVSKAKCFTRKTNHKTEAMWLSPCTTWARVEVASTLGLWANHLPQVITSQGSSQPLHLQGLLCPPINNRNYLQLAVKRASRMQDSLL